MITLRIRMHLYRYVFKKKFRNIGNVLLIVSLSKKVFNLLTDGMIDNANL